MKNPIAMLAVYKTGLLLSEPDFNEQQLNNSIDNYLSNTDDIERDNRIAMIAFENADMKKLDVLKDDFFDISKLPLTDNNELLHILQQEQGISIENTNSHFTKKLQKDIIEKEKLTLLDVEKDINQYFLTSDENSDSLESADNQDKSNKLTDFNSYYGVAVLNNDEIQTKILGSEFYDRSKLLSMLVSIIKENEQHQLLSLLENTNILPIEHTHILSSITDNETKELYEQGYREIIYSGLDASSYADIGESSDSRKQKGFKIK